MILDELSIHDFGVYAGKQSFKLTPPGPSKPVVLIGALNGGGKTTFLDALQLVLYGKNAQCSNRGQLNFEEYLRQTIHRGAAQDEGSSIEVRFRHRAEGKEHAYRLRRSWRATAKGVSKRLDVWLDDVADVSLSERWDEHVEAIFPSSLAGLFLFDGEKVETLADPATSAEVLSAAMGSLLGLDLLSQLDTDLTVLERRKRKEVQVPESERTELATAEGEAAAADLDLEAAREALAGATTRQVQLSERVRSLETRFRQRGGELADRTAALESELKAVQAKHHEVAERLRQLASGSAPLLLVPDLLAQAETLGQQDLEARRSRAVLSTLRKRDDRLLKAARQQGAGTELLTWLGDYLDSDRAELEACASTASEMGLNEEALAGLMHLRRERLPELATQVRALIAESEQLLESKADLERSLAGVPSPEAIEGLRQSLADARAASASLEAEMSSLAASIAAAERSADRAKAKLARLTDEHLGRSRKLNAEQRILLHSNRVRETITAYRGALLERHAARLSTLILESFWHLARKERLVTGLRIDPTTRAVELAGADGNLLPQARLSAGERQLLAISILWGLARASGRTLPTVIDTPLGRLDSKHRQHLVERYFPSASHQVILLSTDEEVDETLLPKLRPSIGHSYLLSHDDATRATTVTSGYFQ